ncbi:MAG TPA: NAD(+) synthase [Oligoflexus sp.]|uniref:NAD(+) synthase n=1 Tax=Oligoflexus sp. TaxID=1971216 RepID=UPI002D3D9DFF|nr:NAD(+) synthase [Oligoflexus sp.]HYX32478.1 NAD(+) synthase [Oligoflexus sp.]
MDRLRIAGASINQTPMDWDGNVERLARLIRQARAHKVQVMCFPELCITGYNCEDTFGSVHTARRSLMALEQLIQETDDITVVFGLPVYHRGSMFNCAAVAQNKKLLGINPKKLLAREGVHYEPRWFRPWPFHRVDTIALLGQSVPFGDVTYQLGNLQMGIVICEEAWSAEGTASDSALSRCELVVNLSASHFALGKARVRETLVADASRAFQVHYLYTNLLGLEAGRSIYDGEIILGECGRISSRSHRFQLSDGNLLIRDVDLDMARVAKLKNRSVLDSSIPDEETERVVSGQPIVSLGKKAPEIPADFLGRTNDPYNSPQLEFLQAEKLGLFDYLRKSRSKGCMISLSGGCDSSVIAVLCAHMIAEALKELGPVGLSQRLHWAVPSGDPKDPRSWIREHVSTLYQGTKQSGDVTRRAASELASALHCDHHEVEVQDLVNAYIGKAEALVGRKLEWQTDDVPLQNIQARARAPMVWLMANLRGFLLLATSNRSEIAVGYATMDGDTAGGLAPLGGIDKHFLRQWLRWAEHDCPLGLGRIPALKLVNEQEPTAELRPAAAGQKDELDLMPYEILNAIEAAFVRDRMEPESLLNTLRERFTAYSEKQLRDFLARFYRLWSQNQWKRERYAAGFHLDDYNLDPTSWCRFPILSVELKFPD